MDAFNVAFRIPNLARDLFAEGAMSAAFVPTFTATLARHGRAGAWRLGNLVINALLVATAVLVVLGIVFAPLLIGGLAEDYRTVPGKIELTTLLTRLMLPFLTLVAIAAAFMGMLNSLGRFFVPALSPAMFNVATIACAFLLVRPLQDHGVAPILAIAIGTLVGGAGQVLLQWLQLRREGYRYEPVLNLRDAGVRRVLLLMGPGTIGLAATNVNLIVNTTLATSQGTGAVSWLNYAFRLMYLPIGLFGVSIATAVIPTVARHAARGNHSGLRTTLSSGLRLMLMLNVPATLGLIVLAHPIIAVIFERDAFTVHDTAATAAALMFYAPGLIGYSTVKIAAPAFYALGDSRTPVVVSIMTMVVNVALNIALVREIGYRGLAMGTAIASLLNAGVLLWLLRRRLGGLDDRRVIVSFVKILVATAVMALVAWSVNAWLEARWPGARFDLRVLRLSASIALSVLALAAAASVLRVHEFNEAVQLVTSRVFRRRAADTASHG